MRRNWDNDAICLPSSQGGMFFQIWPRLFFVRALLHQLIQYRMIWFKMYFVPKHKPYLSRLNLAKRNSLTQGCTQQPWPNLCLVRTTHFSVFLFYSWTALQRLGYINITIGFDLLEGLWKKCLKKSRND